MTTESDRELLELAAKAAGMDGAKYQEPESWFEVRYGMTQAMYHESTGYWNPFEDDGDALRLACKLKINIGHMMDLGGKEYGINCWPHGRGDCGATEDNLTDYAAATRRAIVRAAAAIGAHKEGD